MGTRTQGQSNNVIHEAAANAVGEVFINDERNGHCVLIGPRLAVTCAHVLDGGPAQPDVAIQLAFKRCGFSSDAKVIAWRPFEAGLSAGSDLALLELSEEAQNPSHVQLESERPATNAKVVAFEFQTGRSDGDPREADVHHANGAVISLAGHQFIDPGMSGTGLFYREPGERLLGIVCARPANSGQTEAYVIPADEILKLTAQTCPDITSAPAAIFETMITCFLATAGDNLRPYLESIAQTALAVLDTPPEKWTEQDINELLSLHVEISGDDTGGQLPPGLVEVLNRLAALTGELAGDTTSFHATIPLEPDLEAALETARSDIAAFTQSPECPDQAKRPASTLINDLNVALATQRVRPRKLSHSNELLRQKAGSEYRRLGRTIPFLWSQRADLLPEGTVFADSLEPWAPDMVVIPTGQFLMGSPEDEADRLDVESPQHAVSINTRFAMARYTTTFEEYDAYCKATGNEQPDDKGWARERYPVINVTWEDAQRYLKWLSDQTGAVYRLPSEAEWEFTCRAGSTTRYSFGNEVTTEQANFNGSKMDGIYRERTVPVDDPSFHANPFGLFHMHGNILEWCEDDYESTYNDHRSQQPFQRKSEAIRRVVRGGSWYLNPLNLRSAFRDWVEPSSRVVYLGFRPARTL